LQLIDFLGGWLHALVSEMVLGCHGYQGLYNYQVSLSSNRNQKRCKLTTTCEKQHVAAPMEKGKAEILPVGAILAGLLPTGTARSSLACLPPGSLEFSPNR